MTMDNAIKIGKITKAHGIKGNISIKLFLENKELIEKFNNIFDKKGNNYKFKIINIKDEGVIAKCNDITDRNLAEELVGKELYINREELPDIEDEEEYYHIDLIGLDVLDNESNEKIGTVLAFHDYGAGDLIEIKLNNKPSIILPFDMVNVPYISLKEKIVKISPVGYE